MKHNNTIIVAAPSFNTAEFVLRGTEDKAAIVVEIDKQKLLKRLGESPVLLHALLVTLNGSIISRGRKELFVPFLVGAEDVPTWEQVEDLLLTFCGPVGYKLTVNEDDEKKAAYCHGALTAAIAAGKGDKACAVLTEREGIPVHLRSTREILARYYAAKRTWARWEADLATGDTPDDSRDEGIDDFVAGL